MSLTVFQRTPTAVGIRDNGPTNLEWFKSLPPGWQQARVKSFNQIANGENVDCPVDDGWARFYRRLIDAAEAIPKDMRTAETTATAQEIADFDHNEIVRARVDEFVRDPQKAAALKAYYRTQCKRPGFSDDYLPVFDQANVSLVDVSGGIERISKRGVVVAGVEHELDCLVFCTGFELGTTWVHQAGYDVMGRDGQLLSAKWALGLRTYQGLFSHGFPNIFFMGLTQTGTTISVPHMLQEQVDHLIYIIKRCIDEDKITVEATAEAETQWQSVIGAVNEARRPFQEACTPGYFNADGLPDDKRSAIGSGIYFPSTQFFDQWAKSRQAGDFAGLFIA
jgi:cyclohexanone monooxygenase